MTLDELKKEIDKSKNNYKPEIIFVDYAKGPDQTAHVTVTFPKCPKCKEVTYNKHKFCTSCAWDLNKIWESSGLDISFNEYLEVYRVATRLEE